MTGRGEAFGAITVLNATANGIGCSLAINAPTRATWDWVGHDFDWRTSVDDRLACAVYERASDALGRRGAVASCDTPFPPGRGLKTSSAAATALLRAAWDAAGSEIDIDELDTTAVRSAKDAGVTLTGAYDDQVAVSRGGCHVTDNAMRRVLRRIDTPSWHVAVWVPEAEIPKNRVAHIDPAHIRKDVERAAKAAMAGDVAAALRDNGRAFLDLYSVAGLPVSDLPVRVAYENGATSAGLSGTGPAVAALFEHPVDLPAVPGGQWSWHRTVPATTRAIADVGP